MNLLRQNSLFLVLSVNFPVIKSDASVHRGYISILVLFYNSFYILLHSIKLKSLLSQSAWGNLMTIYLSHPLCPSFSRERCLQCSTWYSCTHNTSLPLMGCAVAGSDNCWAGPREWGSPPHPLGGRNLLFQHLNSSFTLDLRYYLPADGNIFINRFTCWMDQKVHLWSSVNKFFKIVNQLWLKTA